MTNIEVFSQELQLFSRLSEKEEYSIYTTKTFTDSTNLQAFLARYLQKKQSNFYFEAGFDSIISINDSVKAYFTTNEQFTEFTINYGELPFRLKKIKRINALNYNSFCGQIVDYYTNRGYLFAEAKLDSINVEKGKFVAKLNVALNERITIDSLIIDEKLKIKRSYLERALELRHGSVLTTKKIDKIEQRLQNISFLEQEQPYQLAFSGKKADVVLHLKSKKASTFSGVIGIMPESQTTGKLLITGDIDLSLVNILRRGESLRFAWKKYETQNQNLDMKVAFPYIFNTPLGVGTELMFEKKDTTNIKTDIMVKMLIDNSVEQGFYLYYRHQLSYPIGVKLEVNSQSKFQANLFGFGLKYAMVDNIINPYKGILLLAMADVGQKKEIIGTEAKQHLHSTFSYDLCGFIGIVDGFTIKLRNKSSYIYSQTIGASEYVYIGGLQTIRGFDELSLPTTYSSLASCELRYLFEKKSAVYALCDYMIFGRNHTDSNDFNRALGIGIGIDLNTAVGIFSLVYAVGKQNDNQLKINNSKIHFGYKSYF